MFNDDALNYVGYVFAAIDGGFQFLVNLLPLKNRERIVFLVKELADCGVVDIVTLVLKTVNLYQSLGNIFRLPQN